jgi:hypothetical protein
MKPQIATCEVKTDCPTKCKDGSREFKQLMVTRNERKEYRPNHRR